MAEQRASGTRPSLWVELMGCQVRMVRGKWTTTRVFETGAGDPLVLIHGVGSSAELFAHNMWRLGERFHVYAVDALYHGYSSKEPYDAQDRVARQADALLDFMDAEGIRWAHIAGESMGAGIAFEVGLRHPERCGKLVLNSGSFYVRMKREFPAHGGENLLVRYCREATLNTTRETVRRRMEWLVADPASITDELVEVQYKLYMDPVFNESMRRVYGITAPRSLRAHEEEVAATLAPPVLVLWTDRNRGAGPELGEYLASVFPGGKYALVPGAAHWPQWEQPEMHDAAVLGFLRD